MIRKIIRGSILLAIFVSISSVVQIASAVEPDLTLDLSSVEEDITTHKSFNDHAFSWTPDLSLRNRVTNLYERLWLPRPGQQSDLSFTASDAEETLFSFEVYQGDGLDDLRSRSSHHNITLPDEDTSAYGVTVKQRF